MLTHGISAITLISGKDRNKRIKKRHLANLSAWFMFSALTQSCLICCTDLTGYLALTFIMIFFTGYAVVPGYIRYSGMLNPLTMGSQYSGSYTSFCSGYEISNRESDIILEICNGLTNKEIADKLFISLQTVKDHTHRIYIKTGVRNRVELINRLKDII
ncbi:MAG: LuxR C-terminal-related transcriptional regulator [Bacteroidales bacterium]|nr:LuxR C-terminal-related transcriptional regulator [Bacteroidales bacterium]